MEWKQKIHKHKMNIYINIYDPMLAPLLMRPRPGRSETPRKQKGFAKANMVTLSWDSSSPSLYPFPFYKDFLYSLRFKTRL